MVGGTLKGFVAFVTSRGVALGSKARVYCICLHDVMLNVNETWPVKEDDVIRVERNDAGVARLMLYRP